MGKGKFLSKEQEREIVFRVLKGEKKHKIAKELGISSMRIDRITSKLSTAEKLAMREATAGAEKIVSDIQAIEISTQLEAMNPKLVVASAYFVRDAAIGELHRRLNDEAKREKMSAKDIVLIAKTMSDIISSSMKREESHNEANELIDKLTNTNKTTYIEE